MLLLCYALVANSHLLLHCRKEGVGVFLLLCFYCAFKEISYLAFFISDQIELNK